MSRLVARSAAAVSLLLVVSCGESTQATQAVDVGAGDQQTPSVSAPSSTGASSASPLAEPTGQTRTPPPSPAVDDEDLGLVRDFIAFAVRPSADAGGRLPFAGEVQLGLSRDLTATLGEAESSDASAWVLDAEHFRAYTGPFDALESIRRHADESRSASVRARRGAFQVSVGDHPHCASPPVPAPQGFERHRRVSVQPSESTIDSCLAWFTVDLFLDVEGNIAAVTLDIWEP